MRLAYFAKLNDFHLHLIFVGKYRIAGFFMAEYYSRVCVHITHIQCVCDTLVHIYSVSMYAFLDLVIH